MTHATSGVSLTWQPSSDVDSHGGRAQLACHNGKLTWLAQAGAASAYVSGAVHAAVDVACHVGMGGAHVAAQANLSPSVLFFFLIRCFCFCFFFFFFFFFLLRFFRSLVFSFSCFCLFLSQQSVIPGYGKLGFRLVSLFSFTPLLRDFCFGLSNLQCVLLLLHSLPKP